MVRRSPHWRKPAPKALSSTERVIACYAIEGKAYIHHPLSGESGGELALINEQREIAVVPPNNELRHGSYDVVDPDLADLSKLPTPNREPPRGPSTPAKYNPPDLLDVVPWDEDGNPES